MKTANKMERVILHTQYKKLRNCVNKKVRLENIEFNDKRVTDSNYLVQKVLSKNLFKLYPFNDVLLFALKNKNLYAFGLNIITKPYCVLGLCLK